MKIISSQTLFCSALALLLSAGVSPRDVAAGGGGAPEPGAGCEAAIPDVICSVTHGPPYSGSAVISFDSVAPTGASFTSIAGATQRGNSPCRMGDTMIMGGQPMDVDEFNSLTRRDIRGFCVQNAPDSCGDTELAEVTAVQRFDVTGPGQYAVQVHLLPVTCQ